MSQWHIGNGRVLPTSVGLDTNGNAAVPPPGTPAFNHQESSFTDGSGPIFTMYLEKAEKEDDKMAESWKGDADGILVFTGLFSATVATFIGISLQNLTQNSQDTSAFYLARLYQLSAQNGPNGSAPITLPSLSDPSSFSPSSSAIWVNILWFLSLVISLTCALLATLLQQWARRYLRLTKPPYAPHKRARIRTFFKEGVDKLGLPWVVETLPGLLHISVFLFFAGLVIFIFDINHAIFKAVVSCISACAGLYICASLMPLFRRDSPYYTPLSGLIWISNLIAEGIPFFIFISFMRWLKAGSLGQGWVFDHWGPRIGSLWYGMLQAAENAALELPSDIDGRAIESLVRTLDEDHEMERLFAAIPGFLHSKVVDEPAEVLLEPRLKYALTYSITSFMERTLSSDLVSQDVKLRRGALCAKVLEVEPRLLTWAIQIYPFYRFLGWIDFGVLVSRQTGNPNKSVAYTAKDITATFTEAIGRTEERWFPIILRQMGVDEATLRQYISYGDSLSLANLLYRIRNALCYSSMDFPHRSPWPPSQEDARIRIEDTLPELQHQFCEVWNRSLDRITPSGDASTMRPWARFRWISILAYLHDFFETLHPELAPSFALIPRDQWTDNPPPYQRCTNPMHRTEGLREIDATPPPPPTSSGPPLAAIPSFMIPPQLVGTEADGIAVPSLEPVVLSVPLLSDPQQDVPTSPAILAHASHVVLLGNPQCPPPAPEDAIPAPGNLTAAHLSLASPSHHADQAEAAPESQEHPEALPLGDDDEAVSQSTGAVTTERMALVTGAQTFRRLPVRDEWQSPV